ncbi:MAG: DUF4160 domain-containing protein [Candidatus Nealsonbacteria bacterium]|nr:DUF4160 domain-containing protein [Candidatus Nealsonbacteria bacterium]
MPTVLRSRGYRFFFFSLEGSEPPHVHVEKAGDHAKFWLNPVSLARSRGFLSRHLAEIRRLVEEHRAFILERWHEHFADQA